MRGHSNPTARLDKRSTVVDARNRLARATRQGDLKGMQAAREDMEYEKLHREITAVAYFLRPEQRQQLIETIRTYDEPDEQDLI